MSDTLYIKKNKLPVSPDEAIEFLYDYFNEFEMDCIEFDDYYQINLRANQYTYCENVSTGLEFLGIKHEDIKNFCSMRDKAVLCLSENWLPFAFSKFLSQTNNNISGLTILHIDDHRDLMSPYLSHKNGLYFDMISGNTVDFADPLTVRRAVESGAITIGSMLTAIVYSLQYTDIFHIKENVRYKSSKIKKECFPDNLLSDNCNRIAIKTDDDTDCGIGEYHITSEWSNVIAHIDVSKPCLLHIDMDYFNNRYNASTSWMENKDRHDPPFDRQKILMDALFEGLKSILKLTEVCYVMIGISPSFYPVEYWRDGLRYLVDGLDSIGIPVGNILDARKLEEPV